MGGFGSGRNINRTHRKYLDEFLSIDINFLNKNNALALGSDFSLSWGNNDDPVTSMAITVKEEGLKVLYNQKTDNGYGGPCEAEIGLTYTRCNYGSRRPWFLCPDCNARSAKLYHLESGFICRKCSNLSYQSQSESQFSRAIRKNRKLRHKLGVDESFLSPVTFPLKGMHWKTFNLLNKKLEATDKLMAAHLFGRYTKSTY